MKDQYFGDVNDFRKYGLLRRLCLPDQLRLGVCWMRTEADDRSDGDIRGYLDRPGEYRHHDPELFDWLRQAVVIEQDRRVARIESSGLLGPAVFQSEILADDRSAREVYFAACRDRFDGCDLVFFDPDNGLEIKSCSRGRKDSCKFLFWDELCNAFGAGASVLTYQHFIRMNRDAYIAQRCTELAQRLRPAAIFTFRTPNVLFLLASQPQHAEGFRRQLTAIQSTWGATEIVGAEFRLADEIPRSTSE